MKKQGALMSGIRFREIFRLGEGGFSQVEIAQSCGCSRSTVQDYLERAKAAELTYEALKGLSDSEVFARIGKKSRRPESKPGPEVDLARVHAELQRRGVTLQLLFQELFGEGPGSYSYSTFCRRYKRWRLSSEVSLRQFYRSGEKAFTDFSGLRLSFVDEVTGETRIAEIFVGTLGASNYTYVEATISQELPCWLGAQQRMFEFFGGVPEAVVPDNLRSGVTTPCRYEPVINRSYQDFAEYYSTAIIPARVKKPKDKAKVEKAVQDIQHWVLAPLRDRSFGSVAEINVAIRPLLEAFNRRFMREYGATREELFQRLDKPALKALPAQPFQFAVWKEARVNIDYHIEYEHHYYSVFYYLVRKQVWIKASEKLIEIFYENKRVAFHVRSRALYKHTTLPEHMPPNHQAVKSWTHGSFVAWSKGVGPETAQYVDTLFAKKEHPEQAFRAILGLQRLAQKYSPLRLENACRRGNHCKLTNMRSIRSILESGLDKAPLTSRIKAQIPLVHCNLRGHNNFH